MSYELSLQENDRRMIFAFDENILLKERYENMNYFLLDSLEQLAALKVVVSLCRLEEIERILGNRIISYEDIFNFDTNSFESPKRFGWCNNVEKILATAANELPIPTLIKKSLPPTVRLVSHELSRWICSLEEHIEQSNFPQLIQYVVWKPDGFINDFETARRIVIHSTLTGYVKFKLICLYCLKDCIDTMYSKDDFDPLYMNTILFKREPLTFYWMSYVVDNLAEVRKKIPRKYTGPLHDYYTDLQLHDEIEVPACLYFWQQSSDEKKVQRAQYFIEDFDFDKLLIVFSLLNEMQQQQLSILIGDSLLKMALSQVHLLRYFLPLAYRFRNFITREEFHDVCKVLIEKSNPLYAGDRCALFYQKMFQEFRSFVSPPSY